MFERYRYTLHVDAGARPFSFKNLQFTTVLRIIIIVIDTINMRMIMIMLMAAIHIAPKALYFILNSTATKISMKLEIN